MSYPKSGKNGSATFEGTEIPHVTNIQMNDTVGVGRYASSSTGGKMSRIAGHEDAEGSFDVIQKPSFSKGAFGTLVLKEDSGVNIFNGRAMITGIEKNIPVEDEQGRISYTVSWGQAPLDENDSSSSA